MFVAAKLDAVGHLAGLAAAEDFLIGREAQVIVERAVVRVVVPDELPAAADAEFDVAVVPGTFPSVVT